MNETTLRDAAMTQTLPESAVPTTKDAPAIPRPLRSVNPTMKFDAAALGPFLRPEPKAEPATEPLPVAPAAPVQATVKLSAEEALKLRGVPANATSALPPLPPLPPMPSSLPPTPPLPVFPHAAHPHEHPSAPPTTTSSRPAMAVKKSIFQQPRLLFATGLAVLLLLGVASYASVQLVFASNRTWIAPTLLSVSDPRVVQVTALVQQESLRRSELLLHKKELEGRLKDARRWVQVEESFQASYKAALRSDLEGQRAELRRTQQLLASDSNDEERPEHLRSAELESRVAALKARMRALETALRDERVTEPTYNAITVRRQVDLSLLAADKARELIGALTRAATETDQVLAEKDALLKSIESSPYRLAAKGDVVLGFVPYENLANVKNGDALFGCRTSLLFCRRVGTIEEVLAGEVRAPHPMLGHELRGQLLRLTLTESRSLERPMLFASRAPLGI